MCSWGVFQFLSLFDFLAVYGVTVLGLLPKQKGILFLMEENHIQDQLHRVIKLV